MKSRIKGTNILVECIKFIPHESIMQCKYVNGPNEGSIENIPIDFLVECDVKKDYKELRNQAAVAAMQGLLSNEIYFKKLCDFFGTNDSPSDKLIEQVNYQAIQIANDLVKELKNNADYYD